jgi:hypothetical protein
LFPELGHKYQEICCIPLKITKNTNMLHFCWPCDRVTQWPSEIFLTFEKDIANITGTLVENVKRQKSTHPTVVPNIGKKFAEI